MRDSRSIGCGIGFVIVRLNSTHHRRIDRKPGPRRHNTRRPPGFTQLLSSDTARGRTDCERYLLCVCPQNGDIARIPIWSMRISQGFITVIPDDDQPKILHWCKHSRASSDNGPDRTAQTP